MIQKPLFMILGFAFFTTSQMVSGQIPANGTQDQESKGSSARILVQTVTEPTAIVPVVPLSPVVESAQRTGQDEPLQVAMVQEESFPIPGGMIHHDSFPDLSVTPGSDTRVPEFHPLPSIPELEQQSGPLVLFTSESKEFFHRRLMFEQPNLELYGYPDRPLPGFFTSGGKFFGDAFRYPLRVCRGVGKQYEPTRD